MDDFQKSKDNRDIDLSEFDLTDFKEYFEEEDAQREAEEKLKSEQEAKEADERLAIEEQLRLEAQQQAEEEKRRAAQELAERKRVEFEAREKEEARRAAEMAAAATLAAQKAEEAKIQEQKDLSERLLNQNGNNNEMSFEQAISLSEPVVDKAESVEFSAFSSILDIKKTPSEQNEESEINNNLTSYNGPEETPKGSKTATVICIILAVATIICSVLAVYNFRQNKAAPEQTTTLPVQTDKPDESFDPYSDLKVGYNDVQYPASINEKLKALYSENNDLAGWLTIDGTGIDYPIVQESDNKHYLSNHNVYDESARYGTPFLDFRCSKTELSKNTIIYGHRMKNGTHFGLLEEFADIEHYKKHPVIHYETLSGSYTFKVYAAFYATTQGNADSGYVFDYYNPKMSNESFKGYIQLLNQYALYTTDAGLESSDKIITLSTCAHVYDNLKDGGVNTRFVVVGRLLREGENEAVDTEKVTVNSDYRRPQIWYDKNGKSNPYSSYRNWKPTL